MPMYVPKKRSGFLPQRRAVVEQAFMKLDNEGKGFIDVQTAISRYDSERIPIVWKGDSCQGKALDQLKLRLSEFTHTVTNSIAYEDFLNFYIGVSDEIDQSRYYDKDGFFENVVRLTWKLDEDELPHLAKTNIAATTLDLPASGMKRVKDMDLVFCSEETGGLLSFRCVVRTVFARNQLPLELQGYFALYGELDRVPVRYLQGSKKVPNCPFFDFVWPTEDGQWVGFKSVISPSIELKDVPDGLKALIKTQQESSGLGVIYLPTIPQPENPNMVTTNSTYGRGAPEATEKMKDLKTRTFNGTATGTKYFGKVGKFTEGMPPVLPPTGLNCGVVRHPIAADFLY